MNNLNKKYQQIIARQLSYAKPESIFFYWKGRVALYALLKAMKIGIGDEVIIPGFTCVVVPNAIKYTGAQPIYVDIEKKTLNSSFDSIKKAITNKTKVIICQNTFGLSTDVDRIAEYAKQLGIYTIEDCTHGFGGVYKGRPNGSYCDAAFYSTQWNKPFSTGVGGFSVVNNEEISAEVVEINKQLIPPSFKDSITLSALLFTRDYFLTPNTYWILRRLYRWLSRHNIVVGSSQAEELFGSDIPDNYFQGASDVQIKKGIKSIKRLNENLEKRRMNAEKYTVFLKGRNKYHVDEQLHKDHAFLKYPILVTNRNEFELKAEKAKIELGDWFCSPIHPITLDNDLSKWNVDLRNIPVAHALSKQVVNIPTDTNDANKVIAFLENNINYII